MQIPVISQVYKINSIFNNNKNRIVSFQKSIENTDTFVQTRNPYRILLYEGDSFKIDNYNKLTQAIGTYIINPMAL